MNAVLKIFLSMSVSGGLLILALLLGKRFLKDKISRQWQYYIWLVVILRLLLPLEADINLLGKPYQAMEQAGTQAALIQQHPLPNAPGDVSAPAAGLERDWENAIDPAEDLTEARPLRDIGSLLANHIWLLWLTAALGLLIRKITIYQSFIRYIKAGLTPVSDIEILDRLSIAAEQTGIKKPVELCNHPLISSPLLIGFFHPCIVLPGTVISQNDLPYIIMHELTHYKRRDMFYKWLVQVTVCLHWFNPLVHLMSREITKACEFSCDEAVLTKMGCANAQDYGKTLLNAMAEVKSYKENPGAVTLSENKRLLKERLGAIMNFRKKSKMVWLLTGVLTLCIISGASFIGIYPAAAAFHQTPGKSSKTSGLAEAAKTPAQGKTGVFNKDYASQAEQYYEAGSLPLFEMTFPRLDESEQRKWLEKFYADDNAAFFSVAVSELYTDAPLIAELAEKAYKDNEIAIFSILADCMDAAELELWLDRALEDDNWSFQSMLFDKLNMDDEKDAKEKEWDEQQLAEYRAAGVTKDGKKYYYQGQLVNIFLDIRSDGSFYTLDMNAAGTINIKIIRNTDNKITGVAYMTDEEVVELLGDDERDDLQEIAKGRIPRQTR